MAPKRYYIIIWKKYDSKTELYSESFLYLFTPSIQMCLNFPSIAPAANCLTQWWICSFGQPSCGNLIVNMNDNGSGWGFITKLVQAAASLSRTRTITQLYTLPEFQEEISETHLLKRKIYDIQILLTFVFFHYICLTSSKGKSDITEWIKYSYYYRVTIKCWYWNAIDAINDKHSAFQFIYSCKQEAISQIPWNF